MKKDKLSASLITLCFTYALLLLSPATVNAQTTKAKSSLDSTGGSGSGCGPKGSLCLNSSAYLLTDSVGGNGTGGGPKKIMINNYTFEFAMKGKKYPNLSNAKTINVNGQIFELQEYDKYASQLFEASWLIIDNKLYKKKIVNK